MTIRTITIIITSLALGLISSNSFAQTCGVPPTCESLGFDKTVAQCKGVTSTKCPFDLSKISCTISPKYGDILFSDMSYGAEMVSGKTPIGIVLDPYTRSAMALVKSSATHVFMSSTTSGISTWSNEQYPISGRLATNQLLADTKGVYPAANYANSYTTAGTSEGQWYLPSASQLYIVNIDIVNINKLLEKTGNPKLWNTSVAGYIFSSSIYSTTTDSVTTYYARSLLWFATFNNIISLSRTGGAHVLPFIDF